MTKLTPKPIMFFLLAVNSYKTGLAIDCYQCNSSGTMECGDGLMNLDGGILTPTPCDHVYDASYCIKQTEVDARGLPAKSFYNLLNDLGLTRSGASYILERVYKAALAGSYQIWMDRENNSSREGGIETKRSCSSLDLGNYCNYVRQPGDKHAYRTCIYTCGTDGCNGTSMLETSAEYFVLALFQLFFYII